jgi:hypothetical protein
MNLCLHSAVIPDRILEITLKVPQMYQLGNCGLVLSRSFKTGITLALLHGWNVLSDVGAVTKTQVVPHADRIRILLKSSMSLWAHPLLIPVILLEDHISRADRYKGFELSLSTNLIEGKLGVTHSGRNTKTTESLDGLLLRNPIGDSEEKRVKLTAELNTTMTNAISFLAVLQWDIRCCCFLRDVCDKIQQFDQLLIKETDEVKDSVDYLACTVASISDHAESIKARLNIQLSVVRQTQTSVHPPTTLLKELLSSCIASLLKQIAVSVLGWLLLPGSTVQR